MPEVNETSAFFETLYRQIPDGSRILIWTLPDKKSVWCPSIEDATKVALSKRKSSDVYFEIGLAGKPYSADQRCVADEVIAIPGVWADIDIAHSAHKKKNLPVNRKAVAELLEAFDLPPSITVHSGHGLQLYWTFRGGLWVFSGPEEREKAQTLVRRFNATIRTLALSRGWTIDSTFDFARVFRVPGTVNRKERDEPVPVYLVDFDPDISYSYDQIFEKLIDREDDASLQNIRKVGREYGTVLVEEFTLDPKAKVDAELWECLCSAEPKFKSSWDRTRKDFSKGDYSASSYDLSLATYAALSGWGDQEIVDLLIHSRRKHGDDLKLRPDYYRRTLTAAKSQIRSRDSMVEIEDIASRGDVTISEAEFKEIKANMIKEGDAAPDDEEVKRQKMLLHLSNIMGIRVNGITEYISEESIYRIDTERGNITLGGISGLTDQTCFRRKIQQIAKYNLPAFKAANWHGIVQVMLGAIVSVSAGDESTERGCMREWLDVYLSENPPAPEINESVIRLACPYFDVVDGKIKIFGSGFRDWVTRKYGEKIEQRIMGTRLRIYGALPETVNVEIDGKHSTRSAWALP